MVSVPGEHRVLFRLGTGTEMGSHGSIMRTLIAGLSVNTLRKTAMSLVMSNIAESSGAASAAPVPVRK